LGDFAMSKTVVIVVIALLGLLEVLDLIHDFIANAPIHYFAQHPFSLLIVAAIAVLGGLLALGFSRLSPAWQGGIQLISLGFRCDNRGALRIQPAADQWRKTPWLSRAFGPSSFELSAQGPSSQPPKSKRRIPPTDTINTGKHVMR
jgi:hypothetical protein